MHHGTDGDVLQSERVAHLDIGTDAARHLVADVEADGGEDVALFAVCIDEEGDVRAAVGIVLDALDRCGDAVLIALEIDDAVLALVAAPMWRTVILPALFLPPDLR